MPPWDPLLLWPAQPSPRVAHLLVLPGQEVGVAVPPVLASGLHEGADGTAVVGGKLVE